MEKQTVFDTVRMGLCVGCGICRNVCPRECISWRREKGMFLPEIHAEHCISCGRCAMVCPGLCFSYSPEQSAEDAVRGQVLRCYNGWSTDAELRHRSASGGMVSTIVKTLLETGAYDVAFCVDSYDYRRQLVTRPMDKDTWDAQTTPKSRYLPVSHERAIDYIKKNPDKKGIFIGTSCAVRGFLRAVELLKLMRENYLVLGLFCDRVFNYNVYDYLRDTQCHGDSPVQIHFKNKESGGWPGDMKFIASDGQSFYRSKSVREAAKPFFMPERCNYCVDKLNVCADISLGDNYTGDDCSELGSNSVIVRTERGKKAIETAVAQLELRDTTVEKIQEAQATAWRLNNQQYALLWQKRTKHCINRNLTCEPCTERFTLMWKRSLKDIEAGRNYTSDPGGVERRKKEHRWEDNPRNPVNLAHRCVGAVKRKLKPQ